MTESAVNRNQTWGKRSGILSSHGFEYYDVAVKGGEIRDKDPLPKEGEATLNQVLRNNRSFLQIFGRNGAESDQVATVSFGLSGGVETIEALQQVFTRGLGKVEIRRYGAAQNQMNIFIEADFDPIFLLQRMIDAPKEVYANRTGLKAQVAAQQLREKTLLQDPFGKGKFYSDVFYGRRSGMVQAFQGEDGTSVFAWGYTVRGTELFAQNGDDLPQSMTSLALHENVDEGMRDSTLDIQDFMAKTPKGRRRFTFKIDAHPTTEECCPRATSAQLGEAPVKQTDQQSTERNVNDSLFAADTFNCDYLFAPPVLIENPKVYCPTCKKEKKDGICDCPKKYD